jgi:biopolymer transport protein ExbD
MYRRRLRRTLSGPVITLTPLIDTALTLLVIFMVTTPMMHHAIKVELPKGTIDEMKNSRTQKEMIVYIDAKGRLFLNGDQLAQNILIERLKAIAKQSAQDVVVVKADESVSYGRVLSLVDLMKGVGGITYVALATQQPRGR